MADIKLRTNNRRRNSAGDFASGFASTYGVVGQVVDDYKNSRTRQEIEQVDEDYAPSETEVASGEEQWAAVQNAKANALASATTDEERAQVERDYAPTMAAVESRRDSPASVAYSMGVGKAFRQQDQAYSTNDVESAKAEARAKIYARTGRQDDATRVMQNEARRRELADQQEFRGTMRGSADTTAATVAKGGVESARDPMEFFYKEQVPKAIQTLVKQGKIDEAKRYSDFLESQDGQTYAKAYTAGVRQWAVGDYQGALSHFESLYNEDLFPDGRKVKMTRLDDGQLKIDQIDKSGNVLGSKTGKISDLTEQAALALNPVEAVKFMANQTAKRRGEQASFDKAIELELLRQERSNLAEDRRDNRLQMRLDAKGGGGQLSEAQLRTNAEIDAARRAVAGMSPEDVKKRMQSFTATGRTNDDYDPQFIQQFKLSIKRKYGADDEHDQLVAGIRPKDQKAPAAPAEQKQTPLSRAQAALASDPNMKGFTLGEQTQKGFKVFDKAGKHVGYYGRP